MGRGFAYVAGSGRAAVNVDHQQDDNTQKAVTFESTKTTDNTVLKKQTSHRERSRSSARCSTGTKRLIHPPYSSPWRTLAQKQGRTGQRCLPIPRGRTRTAGRDLDWVGRDPLLRTPPAKDVAVLESRTSGSPSTTERLPRGGRRAGAANWFPSPEIIYV